MSLIARIGPGIKKINLEIANPKFNTIEEIVLDTKNFQGKIRVEKTDNFYVNNSWLIEQYRFSSVKDDGDVKSFITGHPLKNNSFYIYKVKLKEVPDSSPNLYKMLQNYLTRKIGIQTEFEKQTKLSQKEKMKMLQDLRSLEANWNFTKDYLKEKGYESLQTQAEYIFFDALKICLQRGWIDYDRKRQIERFKDNVKERNKYLKLSERLTGKIPLIYELNGN